MLRAFRRKKIEENLLDKYNKYIQENDQTNADKIKNYIIEEVDKRIKDFEKFLSEIKTDENFNKTNYGDISISQKFNNISADFHKLKTFEDIYPSLKSSFLNKCLP